MSLLKSQPIYKPFYYPWAYQAWKKQQQIHWLPEEVNMSDDIRDWKYNLADNERELLTQIFRFFTQADIEVNNCYTKNYLRIFEPTEVKMMLVSFANTETIHIDAYSHLLDTIGMPEIEYQAFMKYQEMKDKYDYAQKFHVNSSIDIAKTLAIFGAFTEGIQLFASFVMLLNFQRFGKMKGMGQIITWSIRDETLHTLSIIKLFKTFINENIHLWNKKLINFLYDSCIHMVSHEDSFIDLAFSYNHNGITGMTPGDIKRYIRFIANKRLFQLGLKPIYSIYQNPLPWIDTILKSPEYTNFFENSVTEYSKSTTSGSWQEAFYSC